MRVRDRFDTPLAVVLFVEPRYYTGNLDVRVREIVTGFTRWVPHSETEKVDEV